MTQATPASDSWLPPPFRRNQPLPPDFRRKHEWGMALEACLKLHEQFPAASAKAKGRRPAGT